MLVYQRVSPIFRQTYIAQTGQRSALLRAHEIPTAFKVLSPDSLQSRDLLHGTRPMTGWKYEHGNHGHRVIEWMETYGNPVIRWTNGMKLQPLDGNPEGGHFSRSKSIRAKALVLQTCSCNATYSKLLQLFLRGSKSRLRSYRSCENRWPQDTMLLNHHSVGIHQNTRVMRNIYPLVNIQKNGKSQFLLGKSTINGHFQ